MAATELGDAPQTGTDALRLRVNVIDALMAAKGHTSVKAQAEAFGLDRSYYFEIRSGEHMPSLRVAWQIATVAGTTIEALFGRES